QKDPLIEYKQEAFTMFEGLIHDIHNTFAERFLRAQLVFNAPQEPVQRPQREEQRPTKRYDAMGMLEDVPVEEQSGNGSASSSVMDVGPDKAPKSKPVVRRDPVVLGAGRTRSLSSSPQANAVTDWSSAGRNDPCPCGSGKKFKKCHGAQMR
ncbi:MAG: SEC-C metal-binding domain-containing protein, partial [Gemmatimonadota bacterium]|nr:SEC-C metal-binding domain-containing protein [Gemmatimonadota bacterium]